MRLTTALSQAIRAGLRRNGPLREVPVSELKKRRILPKGFAFGPDLCLLDKNGYHLIHAVGVALIPEWVIKGQEQLKSVANVSITIVATHSSETPGALIASGLAEACLKHGFGLAVESPDGVFPVWRSGYGTTRLRTRIMERGHIPSWLRDELLKCVGFSDYLKRALDRFNVRYQKLIKTCAPSNDDEADVLLDFAKEVSKGDRRLFFPLGLLHVLQEWERSGGNKGKRDHFFHTFNNLFLGFLILGHAMTGRKKNDIPDRYILSPAGVAQLRLWESLWTLTCLFHDPGYMGEDFWGTFAFSIGIERQQNLAADLPESVAVAINNAWETDYLEARTDLVELFKRVSGCWAPAGFGEDASRAFDQAIRRAYFDGKKCGHSLISGLYLIRRCRKDEAAKHAQYDQGAALTGCIIASLAMMFHDPHTRETLDSHGIPSLPFDQLPYAAVLMFADALQDDRRSIRTTEFPKKGVLEAVQVDSAQRTVSAQICLPRLTVDKWPWKIVEYESVLAWINRASEMKFTIDYRSAANL